MNTKPTIHITDTRLLRMAQCCIAKQDVRTTRLLRMAQCCIAKQDVRTNLNWLLVDLDRQEIAATNGHRLIVTSCIKDTSDLSGRFLVRPEKVIPKSWDDIQIELPEEPTTDGANGLISGTLRSGERVQMLCKVSHEKFHKNWPDIIGGYVDKKFPEKEQLQVAFNPNLLADVVNAAGAEGCRLILHGEDQVMKAQFGAGLDEHLHFFLMPLRW